MSLEEEATLVGHTERVWAVAWSLRGELASASGDGVVRIWGKSPSGWACKQVLEEHSRTVRSVAWNLEGDALACSSFDGTVSVWKRSGDSELELEDGIEGHENEVKCVAWDSDGTLLATCSRDKSVAIWEVKSNGDIECQEQLTGHTQDVKCVVWHPSDRMLVSTSYDDTVKVWSERDEGEWSCIQTLASHTSTVWQASFEKFPAAHQEPAPYPTTGSASNPRMVTCSDDMTLKIWNADYVGGTIKWRNSCTLTGFHTRTIFGVDWGRAGLIATACGDDTIRIFQERTMDVDDGTCGFDLVCSKEGHLSDVNCVRWNPEDLTQLASCSDDGTIKIWRFRGP